MTEHLSAEQYDALRELCNIAMGDAGQSLAGYTGSFVELSIPKIRVLQPAGFADHTLANMGQVASISAQLQPFTLSAAQCCALLVLSDADSTGQLGTLPTEQLLADLCQCTAVTCLQRLAELLDQPLTLGAASCVAMGVAPGQLHLPQIASWQNFWAVEINYRLEGNPFNCDLLLLFPGPIQDLLKHQLDLLLAD